MGNRPLQNGPRKTDTARLERNEQIVLRWICSRKPDNSTSIGIIRAKLKISRLPFIVRGFGGLAMWRGHHAGSLPSGILGCCP